ncbi:MAG: GAF domain-containing protein [Ignavibacteriales bacterium]|nr:GAF domain-containing protein [Ignavibacteriales bacterium]
MHDINNQSAIPNSLNPDESKSDQITPDSLSNYSLSEIADLINILKTRNLELLRENQRLNAELSFTESPAGKERSERETRIIYQIIQGVSTTANLNELLTLIHSSLSELLYAENCFVALYNDESDLFSFPYHIDKYDPQPDPSPMYKSCTTYVYQTGKPLLLSQEKFDELVELGEVELVGENSPSWLGVPLVTPSKTIGVLVLQHYEESDVYSERDVQFLDSVASQIAIAIERKRAEDALHESEEMFRILFDQSADLCLLLEDSGFTKVNASTVSALGIKSMDEILHKFPSDISPEKQPDGTLSTDKAKKMVKHALKEGYHKFEWTHLRADKSELPVEVMLTPVRFKGKQYLYSLMRDISERKAAEEEINHKNELLTSLLKEKDKFFSIIAHDLSSPFQTFWGLTEMMTDDDADYTHEEYVEMSKKLNKLARNLYVLLRNLLEWAQMQKGAMDFEPESFNISDVLDPIIETSLTRCEQKGISLINTIEPEISLLADKKMVNSILMNLISNAIKFTSRGGSVSVSGKTINDSTIEISVTDTGIGMTKDKLKKLFKLGEKTKSEGTDGELSTGLGLMLCKEFVEKNGGKIRVESKPGIGSKFYFTLRKSKGT